MKDRRFSRIWSQFTASRIASNWESIDSAKRCFKSTMPNVLEPLKELFSMPYITTFTAWLWDHHGTMLKPGNTSECRQAYMLKWKHRYLKLLTHLDSLFLTHIQGDILYLPYPWGSFYVVARVLYDKVGRFSTHGMIVVKIKIVALQRQRKITEMYGQVVNHL